MSLCHVLYLWLRGLFLVIQDFFLKSFARKPKQQQRAHCMRIVGRRKSHPMVIANRVDFVGLHQSFRAAQCILQKDVSLYSIDGTTATFVRMPASVTLYTPGEASYMYIKQFKEARGLIELPVKVFCQVASGLPVPVAPVLMVNSTAESGCSVLIDALYGTGHVQTLYEPDVFTNLVHAPASEMDSDMFKTVLDCTVRYLCRGGAPQLKAHLIKTRSDVSKLMPSVFEAAPWVKQLFFYSKPLDQICSAMATFEHTPLKTLWQTASGRQMIFETNPELGKALSEHVNSYFTATCWLWAQPLAAYLAARNKGVPVAALTYEQMLMDTEQAFRLVNRHCGLTGDLELTLEPSLLSGVKSRLAWLESGRQQAKQRYADVYSGEAKTDANVIADMVGVQRLDSQQLLPGTLG